MKHPEKHEKVYALTREKGGWKIGESGETEVGSAEEQPAKGYPDLTMVGRSGEGSNPSRAFFIHCAPEYVHA
jgi:hypothetical protein